jgi:hypothetical protein
MNSQQGSSGGTTYYAPQINPYQIAENAAGSPAFGAYAGAAGNAISGGEALFNQTLPGANYAAQGVAGYGSQMAETLGKGGQQAFEQGTAGLSNLFSPEYAQQQMDAATIAPQQQYMQNLANQQASFGGAGNLGSARQAIAGTQLAQQNQLQQQAARAQMGNQIEQNRMQAGQALMGGGQSALTQGLAGTQAGLAASKVPMELAGQYANYLNQFPQNLRGNFSGTGGYTQVQTGSTSSGGTNILPGLSDITAKENIEFVGYRGEHKLYDFNYRGHPERYRGVMAQDVQRIRPEAVSIGENGYLIVDYDQLGFAMIELGR